MNGSETWRRTPTRGDSYRDIAERVIATYFQAFIGLLLAGWSDVVTISFLTTAAVAAIPAGLAVLKGFLATRVGTPDTASLANRV